MEIKALLVNATSCERLYSCVDESPSRIHTAFVLRSKFDATLDMIWIKAAPDQV